MFQCFQVRHFTVIILTKRGHTHLISHVQGSWLLGHSPKMVLNANMLFFCHLYSKGHWSTLLLVSVSRSRPANNNIKTHKHCRSYTKLQSSEHTFFVTQ